MPYSSIIIVLFDDFNRQLDNIESETPLKISKMNKKKGIVGCIRLIAWFIILETFLHLFSVNEIQSLNPEIFKTLKPHVLFTIGIFSGGFFYLKYLFIFGLPIYFAKLDEMIPPRKPVCAFTIARFSNVWRGFDRGLYQFMLRQIYIPFLQVRSKFLFLKYVLSLLMPFVFVLIWHGTSTKYLVWVTFSIVDLIVEKIGISFGKSNLWKKIKLNIGEANGYRLKAAFCVFSVVPGLFGIVSFLVREKNSELIAYKIIIEGIMDIVNGTWLTDIYSPGFCFIYLVIFSYFYSHTCLYFEEKETVKRKKKLE
uniref:Acyltransferase n=1 Tax=Parastrongyloides trichosuri TaxID=131310 RepID=A0A0N5A0H6_PARTI